jgi:hypothetical protein
MIRCCRHPVDTVNYGPVVSVMGANSPSTQKEYLYLCVLTLQHVLLLRETGDMVVDSDEPTNKKIYM